MYKCQGIFGFLFSHNFIPFYDFGEPKEISGKNLSSFQMINLIEASKSKTYVKSICTRCGKEIKR